MAQSKIPSYWCGEIVQCKVIGHSTEGYLVTVGSRAVPGILPSERGHAEGDELLAQLVYIKNDQALLRELSNSHSLNPNLKEALKHDQRLTTSLKFNRATDLLVPPVDDVPIHNYVSDCSNFRALCEQMAQEEFTGCIKSFNEKELSRAGVLLYAGRVVACIYGSKKLRAPLSMQDSLANFRQDASTNGAHIRIYELPANVVLASSALFLGHTLDRNDKLSPAEYLQHMREWLRQRRQTGCFACSLDTTSWLDLYYSGEYAGTFSVEDQKFYRTERFLLEKLIGVQARIEVNLLSPEIADSAGGVGYELMQR